MLSNQVTVDLGDSRHVLTATTAGQCVLLDVSIANGTAWPFCAAPPGNARVAALEGAVAAGLGTSRQAPAPPDRDAYLRWLSANYLFARETPRIFHVASARFAALGDHAASAVAADKAGEEANHHRLAEADLRAMGVDASEQARALAPPSATEFVARFEAYSQGAQPMRALGLSFCLERLSLERDAAHLAAVKRLLAPHEHATRFLEVHSAAGADAQHVAELRDFLVARPRADFDAALVGAFETARAVARQADDRDFAPQADAADGVRACDRLHLTGPTTVRSNRRH